MIPATRGDCEDGPRPCPHRTCRYHMAVIWGGHNGWRRRQRASVDSRYSCVLDIADEGPKTLDAIGKILGCTRENVRQIERQALAKLNDKDRKPVLADCLTA